MLMEMRIGCTDERVELEEEEECTAGTEWEVEAKLEPIKEEREEPVLAMAEEATEDEETRGWLEVVDAFESLDTRLELSTKLGWAT